MSVISDLIDRVNDPDLRARLSEEVARMQAKDSLVKIIEKLRIFNRERDWEQFHDAKNLALSISIEASELNECFLWKNADEADRNTKTTQRVRPFVCI